MAAASQRRYEYEADAEVASIGYASSLCCALSKIGAFESGRTGWERVIVATHPPTALRIERLQPKRDDDVEFQQGDLRELSFADLKEVFRSAL
jgi:Zn-dependent protease with chaperone function